MISYEEFEKLCSASVSESPEPYSKKTQVMVIFSSGYLDEYDKNFERLHPDVAKTLTTHKLYDYIKELFSNG